MTTDQDRQDIRIRASALCQHAEGLCRHIHVQCASLKDHYAQLNMHRSRLQDLVCQQRSLRLACDARPGWKYQR